MAIPSGPQPPAGTVGTGQIFTRASDATMWYGVSSTFDPSQSILVGDIQGLQQADIDNLNTAKAFTTAGLAGKANTVHTHVISDVIGLQSALDAVSNGIPTGCIVIWHGALNAVPGGWLLCDGQNGTPNLLDKFVFGAGGNASVGATGGAVNSTGTTSNAGGFTPAGTIGGTTLTIAQMPSHTHPGSITDSQGAHAHNTVGIGQQNQPGGAPATSPFLWNIPGSQSFTTTTNGAHQHNVVVASQGGDQSHTHTLTMTAVGGHTHSLTMPTMPPYIALGYIMKG